jgi:hypothetical protein
VVPELELRRVLTPNAKLQSLQRQVLFWATFGQPPVHLLYSPSKRGDCDSMRMASVNRLEGRQEQRLVKEVVKKKQ